MKKLLPALVLVPALGYLGFVLTMALPAAERSAELGDRITKLAAHAEKGAQLLAERGMVETTLRDACRTVAPVEPLQLLAYYGEPKPAALAPLGNQAKYFPAKQIFALNAPGQTSWDKDVEVKHTSLPWRVRGVGTFVEDLLTSPPGEWGWRKNRWNEPFHHPLSEVRYVVVHQLESVVAPKLVDGQSYVPGTMTFHSGLFNASTGERLCDGKSVLLQDGKVEVRGRGHTQEEAQANLEGSKEGALMATFVFKTYEFSLGTVCALGGGAVCQATGYPAGIW